MQGSIAFDGTLSGSIAGGGGGGSEVTITPTLSSGTKIADYEIDGTPGELYAPDPEALPGTIVTKVLREYNDTSQTKIMTVTTLDTENSQEVSQDIYAPSPVQCWYTPGLEQDYQIGQFTYGGVTQNVYIPYFQRPLTAGANITIDADNVISASGGGAVNYSTTEQLTGKKWIDGISDVYQRTFVSNTTLLPNNHIILDPSMLSGDYTFFTVKNISLKYEGSTNYYGLNSITGKSIDVALHATLGLFAENYTSYNINSIVVTCEYVKS